MIGWRIGWVCGHERIVRAFADVKDNSDCGQFGAIQNAAAVALDDDDDSRAARATKYKRRLEKLVATLSRCGFQCQMPGGTYFLYVPAPKRPGRRHEVRNGRSRQPVPDHPAIDRHRPLGRRRAVPAVQRHLRSRRPKRPKTPSWPPPPTACCSASWCSDRPRLQADFAATGRSLVVFVAGAGALGGVAAGAGMAGVVSTLIALFPLNAPAVARNLFSPCTATSSGVRTSLSVVMMSPTRRPIRSPVVILRLGQRHDQLDQRARRAAGRSAPRDSGVAPVLP